MSREGAGIEPRFRGEEQALSHGIEGRSRLRATVSREGAGFEPRPPCASASPSFRLVVPPSLLPPASVPPASAHTNTTHIHTYNTHTYRTRGTHAPSTLHTRHCAHMHTDIYTSNTHMLHLQHIQYIQYHTLPTHMGLYSTRSTVRHTQHIQFILDISNVRFLGSRWEQFLPVVHAPALS